MTNENKRNRNIIPILTPEEKKIADKERAELVKNIQKAHGNKMRFVRQRFSVDSKPLLVDKG